MIYNVQVSVVDLVEADTADEAIAKLVLRLRAAGFDEALAGSDAFESDDQPHEHENGDEGPGSGPCTDHCVATHPDHAETRGDE